MENRHSLLVENAGAGNRTGDYPMKCRILRSVDGLCSMVRFGCTRKVSNRRFLNRIDFLAVK